MQVFKVYFKIIKKNFSSLAIYLSVFAALVILFTFFGGNSLEQSFTDTKSPIAFVNEDVQSPLTAGMKNYLSGFATFVDTGTDPQSLADALYYEKVGYVVRIPNGFAGDFMKDTGGLKLEKTTKPDSTSGVYLDAKINDYLNTARLLKNSIPGLTEAKLAEMTKKALAQTSKVELNTYGKAPTSSKITNFFLYLSYSLLAVMILGVTSIMLVFNEPNLKSRNQCSPLRSRNISLQLLSGNLVYAVAVWALLIVFILILLHNEIAGTSTLLLCLNALCFAIAALSISFLIGNLIKGRGPQQAITNVLSLGLSFISGVFVPQQFLGSTVQTLAQFTPVYWYVKAVNSISSAISFDMSSLQPILLNMLIQLGFAAALFVITITVSKQKRLQNN